MKKILIVLLFVLSIPFFAFFYFRASYQEFTKKTFNLSFEIQKWDNWKKIINTLCTFLSNDCRNLKFFSFSENMENMKPWSYTFSWKNISQIFQQLKKWPTIVYSKFTIIPWDTKFDLSAKISKNSWNQISDKFKKLITDQKYIKDLSYKYEFFADFPDIKSLEWFLLPDTYFFKPSDFQSNLFPELLIKTALKNFEKKRKELQNKCKNDSNCNPSKLSNYQILNIASIIEKEWIIPENKPVVADLYIRRFLQKRQLWADRTLCYGLDILSVSCQEHLNYKNLQDKSNPYNTRALVWLPPTPVWNPTYNSIESTFFPEKNEYRYYLHDSNWKIHFGKTAKEHNLNKQKYIK